MSGTPPLVEAGFQKQLKDLANAIDSNYEKIVNMYVTNALKGAGVTPKIRINTLKALAQNFLVPQVQKFEGGWGEHPNDSGGPTMRGVISSTFQGGYKSLFIDAPKAAGLPTISAMAEKIMDKYPGVAKGDRKSAEVKGALYTLLTSEKVASLFIWKFLCQESTGYPIVVMGEDAWLGYIQFEMAWGGGPGSVFGDSGKAYYDGVAKKSFGRKGMGTPGWTKWLSQTLGEDKIPEFAIACFSSQIGFFDRISRPGNKNNVFRKGWFNRLLNNPTSALKMCIIINEVFNKNSTGMFQFDENEKKFLLKKAKIYESLQISYPVGV